MTPLIETRGREGFLSTEEQSLPAVFFLSSPAVDSDWAVSRMGGTVLGMGPGAGPWVVAAEASGGWVCPRPRFAVVILVPSTHHPRARPGVCEHRPPPPPLAIASL